MVIQQFNKLIRNKWLWGAFAIAISAFFAFDFLLDDIGRDNQSPDAGSAGKLGNKTVSAEKFFSVVEDIRGIGRMRNNEIPEHEVNRLAWEMLAMLEVAEKNGLTATENDVRAEISRNAAFQEDRQFDYRRYEALLAENGILPERYEEYLRRQITLRRLAESMIDTATWVAPIELSCATADLTDEFTVRVAEFNQTKEEADKITVDDAAILKWYEDNTNSIALPERVKLRMVRFDATDTNVLARMVVTEDEMRDLYDSTTEKYTSVDTNGVETVKSFDEVRDGIERELRQIAAVQYFETNLNRRAYGEKSADGGSRLDAIAKEDGLEVRTTDWITIGGRYVDGFMSRGSEISRANGFNSAVAELDPSYEDLRYGVITSDRAVWLVEKAEVSPAHVPTMDEINADARAKGSVRDRALKAARAEAFKATVEAIAAQGTNAVCTCATANVSTNYTFAICNMQAAQQFPNQRYVISAASKLQPGQVSEFTPTTGNSAILVVCVDRKDGDAAQATLFGVQARESVAQLRRAALPELWKKWNLKRIGFTPNERSSVDEVAADAEE